MYRKRRLVAPPYESQRSRRLLFGSPIYFMGLTSGMHALLERLFFSNYIYSQEIPSVLGKKMPSAFIYTMNVTEEQAKEAHLQQNVAAQEAFATASSACRRRASGLTTPCSSMITRNMNRRSSRKVIRSLPGKGRPHLSETAYAIGQSLVQDAGK